VATNAVLAGAPHGYDPNQMTDIQIKTAKYRLLLGISNVGFWVIAAVLGLVWRAPLGAPVLRLTDLFTGLIAGLAIQANFDLAGGIVFMPALDAASGGGLRLWLRGLFGHSAMLCAVGVLSYWSFRWSNGFCLSVVLSSLGLFLWRQQILGLVSGTRVRPTEMAGAAAWSANSRDPSFTGGTVGLGGYAKILLPESWKLKLTGAQMHTLIQRRLWEVKNNLPARSLFFVLLWNLTGCRVGSVFLELPGRLPESALVLQFCWMTLWGFLGLLLLPTLSRSAVFAADCAAVASGCDAGGWIQQFPNITGEDGNARTVLQRVFYPIPSAQERLRALGKAPALPVIGNVARTNLFLSLATLTLLGRCVHCNVGRPELWVFPPSD